MFAVNRQYFFRFPVAYLLSMTFGLTGYFPDLD